MKKNSKNLLAKITALFQNDVFTRMLVPELAFEIEWTEVGEPVNKVVVDENGVESLQPIGQGEFVTEDGIVVTDEASNLVEVRDLPAEVEVESPEVPEASGTTSISGTTDTLAINDEQPNAPASSGATDIVTSGNTDMGANMDACVADLIAQGHTQDEAWAICQSSVNGLETAKMGIEKTILEIVGANDGEYTVLVKVENGVVTNATSHSIVDLMMGKQAEIDALKLSVIELEAKMKEPITDPILVVETQTKDFSKMSAYERLMHNKGLKAV